MLHTNKGKVIFSSVILAGALALNGAPTLALQDVPEGSPPPEAVEGQLPAAPVAYCHLKFPAIDEDTLGTDHPQLKAGSEGDTVDFYGPCDHNPLGRDEVQKQIIEEDRDTMLDGD